MTNTGKRYNEEFKVDIIRMIQGNGCSVSSVSKDFGVSKQTIRNWLTEHNNRQDTKITKLSELEIQLKEAKKKIADQEMTIEILKKATAIFAQNSQK